MPIFKIAITAILSLTALFFVFGFFCFQNACGRRKKDRSGLDEDCESLPIPQSAKSALIRDRAWLDSVYAKEVCTTSRDGLRLCGRLIAHPESSKGTVIFSHGYHSSCRRDLSIQAHAVYDSGYDVLLISNRAHGESEGKYICFGAIERTDIVCWAEYIRELREARPIALMGLSMGAATVLMASDAELCDEVRCIIADCPFTSPAEIITNTLAHRRRIIPYPTVYFMNFWSRILAKFDYFGISVLSCVKKNSRPILIIHGKEDRYVPTEMSYRIADADPAHVQLMIVPEARHAQAVYFDTDGYIGRVLEFLENNM